MRECLFYLDGGPTTEKLNGLFSLLRALHACKPVSMRLVHHWAAWYCIDVACFVRLIKSYGGDVYHAE